MEPEILRKLGTLLREGINSEPQAVYLMAAIRKLLEQQSGAKQRYYYLNFHCNWALHSKLSGDAAQKVLNVISDCPLVINSQNAAAEIETVTVRVELANQPTYDHMMF
jgi:hypothetical protein